MRVTNGGSRARHKISMSGTPADTNSFSTHASFLLTLNMQREMNTYKNYFTRLHKMHLHITLKDYFHSTCQSPHVFTGSGGPSGITGQKIWYNVYMQCMTYESIFIINKKEDTQEGKTVPHTKRNFPFITDQRNLEGNTKKWLQEIRRIHILLHISLLFI